MALIPCPSCSKSISSEAEACPDCGHPIKGKTVVVHNHVSAASSASAASSGGKFGCLSFIGLVVLVIIAISMG
jgi:RNA polymerase subunit RPABC4/transcription elongation factor Spt4